LGKRIPLQSVVFITTKCNLSCKHCFIARAIKSGSLIPEDLEYDKIAETLRHCYNAGSRIVHFEGGEPLLWRDKDWTVEDLIQESKRIGFFATSFTTNGTFPIETNADLIWVSIDGTREIHDDIRGSGCFDRLIRNVENSCHSRIYANMVINPLNWEVVEDVVSKLAQIKNFRGISINFHTPHRGVEDLFLPWERRHKVLDKVIELKRQGFPIVNSFAGLKRLHHNNWHRRCWISNFAMQDGKIYPECPGSREGICQQCGYGMGTEMSALFDLRPSAIRAALSLF
jgi:MoaA/NifB/PqqE/SkfB family radical SAM enzyme